MPAFEPQNVVRLRPYGDYGVMNGLGTRAKMPDYGGSESRERLVELSKAEAKQRPTKKRSEKKRPNWWYWLSGALFLVGLIGAPIGASFYTALNNGLQGIFFAVGILLALLFVLLLVVLRRANVHSYRLRYLLDFGNMAGLIVLGFGLCSMINGAFDPHPLEQHEVRVMRAPEPGTRGRPGAIEDWREDRLGEELQLRGIPEESTTEDRVVVVIGPGLFGPWIKGIRLVE